MTGVPMPKSDRGRFSAKRKREAVLRLLRGVSHPAPHLLPRPDPSLPALPESLQPRVASQEVV